MKRLHVAAMLAAGLLSVPAMGAQMGLSYSVGTGLGGVYETFDSIGSAGTMAPGDGTDTYWSLQMGSGTAENLGVANAFPSNKGWNGGPWDGSGLAPLSDRALGLYAGNTTDNPRLMSARFRNDTGAELTQLYVQFDVEWWMQRASGTLRFGGLQAFLDPDGAGALAAVDLGPAFEAVKTQPEASTYAATNHWVDGNAAANKMENVGGLISGLSIPDGGEFYITWNGFTSLTSPGAGYANRQVGSFIDNLWVGTVERPAVVPEPAGLLLAGVGALGLLGRRRA